MNIGLIIASGTCRAAPTLSLPGTLSSCLVCPCLLNIIRAGDRHPLQSPGRIPTPSSVLRSRFHFSLKPFLTTLVSDDLPSFYRTSWKRKESGGKCPACRPDRSGSRLGSSPTSCVSLGNLFIFLESQWSLLVFNNLEQGV